MAKRISSRLRRTLLFPWGVPMPEEVRKLDRRRVIKAGLGAFAFAMLGCGVLPAPSLASSLESAKELYVGKFGGLAMGTVINAQLYADSEQTATDLIDEFENLLEHYETAFTVHREGPLQNVNRNAGHWVSVDCEIEELVERAQRLARESHGAFEPTIGPLVNVWKIGFGGQARPAQRDIDAALRYVDYTRVEVDRTPGACRVKIGPGQSLDLGAIAKGWIGSELVRKMRSLHCVCGMIDLGGNVALLGQSPSGRDWRVGIQRPDAERGEPFAVVNVSDVSVITSGNYERNIQAEGKRYGHILNAVTGEPAPDDIGSVTIVDADGAKADGWCTALFAMGRKKALAFLLGRPDIQSVVVDNELKTVWVSQGLAKHFELIDHSMELRIISNALF